MPVYKFRVISTAEVVNSRAAPSKFSGNSNCPSSKLCHLFPPLSGFLSFDQTVVRSVLYRINCFQSTVARSIAPGSVVSCINLHAFFTGGRWLGRVYRFSLCSHASLAEKQTIALRYFAWNLCALSRQSFSLVYLVSFPSVKTTLLCAALFSSLS